MDTTTQQSSGMAWLDSLTASVAQIGNAVTNYQMGQVAVNNARITPPVTPPVNYITTAGGISSSAIMMLVMGGAAMFLVLKLRK